MVEDEITMLYLIDTVKVKIILELNNNYYICIDDWDDMRYLCSNVSHLSIDGHKTVFCGATYQLVSNIYDEICPVPDDIKNSFILFCRSI